MPYNGGMDKTNWDQFSRITALFSGGERTVGAPVYNQNGVVAYSAEQAQIMFDNIMDVQVNGKPIPFLHVYSGYCETKKSLALFHLIYCQKVNVHALGVATSRKQNDSTCLAANYDVRIGNLTREDKTLKVGRDYQHFSYHVAAAVNVWEGGVITQFVLDPAICPKPLSLIRWNNAFGTKKHPTLPDYTPLTDWKKNYIPPEGAKIERRFVDICEYEISFISKRLLSEQNAQAQLIAALAEKDITNVPNCGPLALKHVNRALSKPMRDEDRNALITQLEEAGLEQARDIIIGRSR